MTEIYQAASVSACKIMSPVTGYTSNLERGLKEPKGPVLVLLNIIRNNGFDLIYQACAS